MRCLVEISTYKPVIENHQLQIREKRHTGKRNKRKDKIKLKKTNKHRHKQNLPAQHTQNQIENEEGSEDDQTDKVDPWQLKAHCIIHLDRNTNREGEERITHIVPGLFM